MQFEFNFDSSSRSYVNNFCFAFLEGKMYQRKKQLVQISSHLPAYINMCTWYTYANTSLPRFIQSAYFGPSQCFVPTPGLTSSTPCVACVCVRAYTHIKIEKTQDKTSISLSVKNNPPRLATSALHKLVEPPTPARPPTQMNKLRIHERTCTPCSDCVADIYSGVKNTCGIYTLAFTGA